MRLGRFLADERGRLFLRRRLRFLLFFGLGGGFVGVGLGGQCGKEFWRVFLKLVLVRRKFLGRQNLNGVGDDDTFFVGLSRDADFHQAGFELKFAERLEAKWPFWPLL